MKNPTKPGTLVSRPELRAVLGVSKERVRQLVDSPDFPAPVDVLDDGRTPLWDRAEMQTYADGRNTAHGRPSVEQALAKT
jgi:hypothetical protein